MDSVSDDIYRDIYVLFLKITNKNIPQGHHFQLNRFGIYGSIRSITNRRLL